MLSTVKMNYGPDEAKIPLRWQRGVLVPVTAPPKNSSEPTFSGDDFK